MAAILAKQKFFENWDSHSEDIPCGSKILWKSLYLARFLIVVSPFIEIKTGYRGLWNERNLVFRMLVSVQ